LSNLVQNIGLKHKLKKCVSLCFDANFLHFSSSAAESSSSKTDRRHITSSRCYTSSARSKPVRIGCASGFWGDTATSVPQLIYSGKLDFLVFDYLSEITMSLLTAAKAKMPVSHICVCVCVRARARVQSRPAGVNALSLSPSLSLSLSVSLSLSLCLSLSLSLSLSVSLSLSLSLAVPIQRCLDLGADIVVTGRCVDSAVALGPLMHSFGWERDDYDLLAAGSLAGHLIECGAQSTGGIFTDWHKVPDWDNMGFPVVECSSNGAFVLSKPPKTGGLVSFGTVAEQLVYEIGDPRRYLLPDVTCDFSQVVIKEIPGVEGGAVRVTGAKGFAPSHDYKVCATYLDGFRATAVCPVGGPRAVEKARRTADSIIKRTKRMFKQLGLEDFGSVNVQVLGAEDTYGANGSREAVIWMAVHHRQKKALELFSREIAPAGTVIQSSGLFTVDNNTFFFVVPRSPVLKPFFFLHPKSDLKVSLLKEEEEEEEITFWFSGLCPDLPSGPHSYRLEELAFTRSGDKGDSANVGEKKHRGGKTVAVCVTMVTGVFLWFCRFTLPGIHGLNFVLQSSLGGGGVASLRSDPQGKAYGQMLLDLKLRGLPDLKSLVD
uniref:Si:ch73-132f6.5 n=1 Tax=Seriola lalandi dorsalis TaxID=1841481 RepID=A0A3B4XN45_SERLL